MCGNSLASLDAGSARKNSNIQFVTGGISFIIGLTLVGSRPWQQFGALGIGIWFGVSLVFGGVFLLLAGVSRDLGLIVTALVFAVVNILLSLGQFIYVLPLLLASHLTLFLSVMLTLVMFVVCAQLFLLITHATILVSAMGRDGVCCRCCLGGCCSSCTNRSDSNNGGRSLMPMEASDGVLMTINAGPMPVHAEQTRCGNQNVPHISAPPSYDNCAFSITPPPSYDNHANDPIAPSDYVLPIHTTDVNDLYFHHL